ncbi:MAG: ferric reductase [Conexibacter sp.]|jgi:predicted ferric reductase|nr:ferric reductase [Conexibacter sp.]
MTVPATGVGALWLLTRGAGAVSLLLLTATLVLGIVDVARWRTRGWPRFVIDAIHRNAALLALVLIAVHVVSTVADGYVAIGWLDAVVPFAGRYRPLWVGFGALAFDLLLALLATSLLRHRIGHRGWRAVHWLAYACWPVAVAHAIGMGTDVRAGWLLAVAIGCIALVVVALGARVAQGLAPARPAGRALGGAPR